MTRPTRDEVNMQIAEAQSLRGTCSRLQVGAVIHRQGRILTTGYNGAPAGLPHCNHECDCTPMEVRGDRGETLKIYHDMQCALERPCETAAHAERNAIDWAARHGIRLEGAEIVTTDTPCWQCAGSIINAGIISVLALREYRDTRGVTMLRQAGVQTRMHKRWVV